jgi:hypothetical protein
MAISFEASGNILDRFAIIQKYLGNFSGRNILEGQFSFDEVSGTTYATKIYGLHDNAPLL